MIRNRLAEIMFERDIKVVRMAKEIGISRNTITNTASNNSEMLQMKTINKICQYLNITPCEFFEYLPYDIEFSLYENGHQGFKPMKNSVDYEAHLSFDLLIDIEEKNNKKSFDCFIKSVPNNLVSEMPFGNDLIFVISLDPNDEQELNKIFDDIPKNFKKMIFNQLTDTIKAKLNELFYNKEAEERFERELKETMGTPGAFYPSIPLSHIVSNADIKITNDFINFY